MRTHILIALVAFLALAGVAEARHVHFAGPHPIAAKLGGGFCYIETPHLHIYPPDHAALYQQVGDEYVFTGDPTPFGYDGEKYKYYGHHPVVAVNGEPVYCYLEGPHFHGAPPPDQGYKTKGGVAFYVGPFSPGYAKVKPQRVKMVNAEYRPYTQYRPVVEVQPPPEWQGEVYVAPPSIEVSAPGVTIGAPGVYVNAPAPTVVVNAPPPPVLVAPPPPRLNVRINAPPPPGVVVVGPPHVYAPAPHVYVGAPAPRVYVGAPRPPGVVVVGPPGVVVKERHHEQEIDIDGRGHGHHDNGKHKGWYK